MSGQVEQDKDIGTDQSALVTRWLRELKLSDAHEDKWRERATKIVKRYRDDDRGEGESKNDTRFNILFANTEVLKGVMYQRTPVPDVRRRFLDKDPIGRQAAQVLQRALSYSVDEYDFDGVIRSVVEDVLLPGRGVAYVKYIPTMGKVDVPQEDGTTIQEDRMVYQSVECDYVEWDMFRVSPAKRWSKVRWVAFGELMTRKELEQFGDAGKKCALDWKPEDGESQDEFYKRALVWKVWDKQSRTVYAICKGSPEKPLAQVTDPLNLEGFFPCPEPVCSVWTTNSLIPVPEYAQYQDQAMELDEITARITHLVAELKRRGVYDATYTELSKLATAGDNEFIAVENFTNLVEKGGIQSALYEAPIDGIAKVVVELYKQREQVKQVIYEVTGIADIVRGSTNASETLGAQEMKARYANVRIAPRQQLIAKFARELLRMKGEIISEKFEPETLKLMTGEDMWLIDQEVQGPQGPVKQKVDGTAQIIGLLRNEKLRGFRVDIETDSTIQPEADTEQKNRIELITAVSQFITTAAPAVQAGVIPMEVAREILSFGVRAFKVSPQLEDALDKLGEQKEETPEAKQQKILQQQVQQSQAREVVAKADKAEAEAVKAKAEALQAQNPPQEPQVDPRLAEAEVMTVQANASTAQQKARMATLQADQTEDTGSVVKREKQTQDAIPQLVELLVGLQQQNERTQELLELAVRVGMAERQLILDAQGMPTGSKPILQ